MEDFIQIVRLVFAAVSINGLIWSAKNFTLLYSTSLQEGICATLNSYIQALKQSGYKNRISI